MITRFSGEFRWLSNFTSCFVSLDGAAYSSTENAYQAAKTLDPEYRARFIGVSPGAAKRLGGQVPIRPDWEDVRVRIMEDLTRQKYSCNPLRSKLLKTGSKYIIEGNTWGDTFWGVCDGDGENHLGHIIMKIRAELQSSPVCS